MDKPKFSGVTTLEVNPVLVAQKTNAIRRQSVRGSEDEFCQKMVLDRFQPRFHSAELNFGC
jgi:hypothetical protein